MKLLALAYPELPMPDFGYIENFRRKHDKQYKLIRPHFTFAFPISDFSIDEFVNEIKKQLKDFKTISFNINSAVIHKDNRDENHFCFLVPDDGSNLMVNLYDDIHSGLLSKFKSTDPVFIPHMTIGSSKNIIVCRKMVDEWNSNNKIIAGKITAIDIVIFENDSVTTIKKIKLS